MIHFLFLCKILLLGLSIAQVLATIQVYLSNLEYCTFLTAVQDAGYLAVPNEHVIPTLQHLGPAFCGGLFFTLTAGASLTLTSLGLAWAWDRLFSRSRNLLYLLLTLLLLCLVSANMRGFSPLITAYLLFVPVVVFRFTLKWLPEQRGDERPSHILYSVIPFLVVALTLVVWQPSGGNTDPFLAIRDSLLLSNPIGRKVNAFYYENSLYATRVFESSRQQLIRSCRLDDVPDPLLRTRITRALLSRDVLPLEDIERPDVSISLSDKGLSFYEEGKLLLTSPLRVFLSNPAEPLKEVYERTAGHTFLLRFIMFSLFFLGALLLFCCTYVPIYLLSGLFLKSTPRAIKAGILWPVAFLSVFLAFRTPASESLFNRKHLSEAMNSDIPHSRINALKYILRNKIDIAGFPAYPSMVTSQHIPERYWLAKALGVSRTRETQKSLYRLLDDPHFNVVCMAIDSLGRRGSRGDVPRILGKMQASDNWYEQWYGYRAIRRLGWQQKESYEEQHR
jgi:hypothetical protein